MAPAARKPKLAQTRLNTPQRSKRLSGTGAAAAASSSSSPSPFSLSFSAAKGKSRIKAKPDQSILSFFKTAPAREESLFVGEEGRGASCRVDVDGGFEVAVREEEEGLYRASPIREGLQQRKEEGEEQRRFNEVGAAVKRRRLSPGSCSSPSVEEAGPSDEVKEPVVKPKSIPAAASAASTTTKRTRAGNPFLDEDSSDDDREDHDDKEDEPAPATSRVRSPQAPVFDVYQGVDHFEPAGLTSGPRIPREAPLRRQQTSGADAGSDYGAAANSDRNDAFESEDFTGEELRAMRYMEEQARLEAEEEEEDEEYGGNEESGEAVTESCPVCLGSLAGATPDQATAHVNSCLDGNPTPIPGQPDVVVEAEAAAVGRRFAKAAVARPGQANPIVLVGDAVEGPSNSAFAKLMSGHAEDAAWATAAAAESASRGVPAYKRTCPFYKIMPGFSICVDAFRYGAVEGCVAYALSHFHSDHYIGLTANWTHGPIYCSKVTGALVKSQLKTAAKYVVELEFEQTVEIPETNGVSVTMIPANHCPGSSLFLFEKTIGRRTLRILHCGDFRACPAHVEHPQLRPETVDSISGRIRQQKIDVCYLDTTYLNPRYSFPGQSDVIQACADLCALLNKGLLANDNSEWERLLKRRERGGDGGYPNNAKDVSKFFITTTTSSTTSSSKPTPSEPPPGDAFTALNGRPHNPNRLLVICGTYSIGKERICVAIAKALNTKIYATPGKIRMCRQLDDPELSALLTPDPSEAQVHMQMLMDIGAETLAEYREGLRVKGCEFGRVVGFRPSGWNYRPPPSGPNGKNGGAGSGGGGSRAVGANLAPSALPTTQLLHGRGWKTRFGVRDLVPQRGSGKEAMCFGVPYSEHSSFRELALFLMALRIERVVPTVNVGNEASRRRMKGWIDRWIGERRRGGLVRVLNSTPGSGGECGEGDGQETLLWEGKDGTGGGVYW